MKVFYSKGKYGLVLMIILVLILQLAGPITSQYAYAEDTNQQEQQEETEEKEEAILDEELEIDTEESSEETKEAETNEEVNDVQESQEESEESETTEESSEEAEETETSGDTGTTEETTEENEGAIEDETTEDEEEPLQLGLLSLVDPVSFDNVELEHVDSNGLPLSGPFNAGSHVKIKFSYNIIDRAQVDTSKIYQFTIPSAIPIITNLNLELKDGSRVLANIEVKTDGTMTVQFLDEVNNENFDEERTGWITIFSKFGNIEVGDGGNTTITFEVNGVSKDITVQFEEEVIEETKNVTLKKTGSYNTSNNEITWTINVKADTTPSGGTVDNVIIKDTIEAGQSYIIGSAKLDGNTISTDPVSGSQLEYKFDSPIADGQEYKITFKTKADHSKFVTQGDTLTFSNTVTGTFGEDNTPTNNSTAKVTTKVNFIQKSGNYVTKDKSIKWTIVVNSNNLVLPAGLEIKDILGAGLEYNNDLKVNNGNPTIYGALTNSGGIYTFKFTNEINTKQTLTFSTKVIDPEAFNSNTSKKYYNKAEISWTGKGDSTSTGNIGVKVPSTIIKKSFVSYDSTTRQTTWKITINDNKVKIINPIVKDILPNELEYVSHSIDGNKIWTPSNNNGVLSLSHTGEINETYTITLVTRIKSSALTSLLGYNGSKTLTNKVTLEGECIETSKAEAEQTITSKVIEKFARGYDYTTKKVKWEIVVNQNEIAITNAVVTDILQSENHKFVAGSLKVNGVDLSSNDYTVSGNNIEIRLGNITEQKSITFETQIPEDNLKDFFKENGEKQLINKATLTGVEIIDGGLEVSATQKIKNTVISKKGNYQSGNDFIDWEVVVNSNELDLNNVILEDTLQAGLIFDSQSVSLNKLTINSNGTYTVGANKTINTNFDSATNKVTFTIGDIENAYILKFRTDIDDEYNKTTFKNTINLKGSNGEENGESTSLAVTFQTGDAGGSGTSTRGSVTVVKVDSETSEKIKLEGAIFELLKEDKETIVSTSLPTGLDGTIVFDNLRMDKYYIRETKAPEGYVLDLELKEVELKKGSDTKHITYEFENKKIKGNIKLIKTDSSGRFLQNAEFALYDLEGSIVQENVKSNQVGEVLFEDVLYGKYTIKETKAPSGYRLNNTIYEVSVVENDTTVSNDIYEKELVVINTRIPYNPGPDPDPEPEPDPDPEPEPEEPENPEEPESPEEPEEPENPEEPESPEEPQEPEIDDIDDEEEPEVPIKPEEPVEPTRPSNPTEVQKTLEDDREMLVQTGTDVDFLLPIGFILMLIGAAFFYREKKRS